MICSEMKTLKYAGLGHTPLFYFLFEVEGDIGMIRFIEGYQYDCEATE
jgi:hypothetical protein